MRLIDLSMAEREHPAPPDADNPSGSIADACNDWRAGDADSISARATHEPTQDAGYTTAGAYLRPTPSVNFLPLGGFHICRLGVTGRSLSEARFPSLGDYELWPTLPSIRDRIALHSALTATR